MSRRVVLGLVVSGVCLAVLLHALDLQAFVDALLSANPLVLLPALGLYFCGVLVRAWRWQLLLRPVQSVPTAFLFRTLIIGFTVNNLLPVRLGEVARALVLSRDRRLPIPTTLATIAVERLFDGLTLCAFLVVGLWLLPDGTVRAGWLVTVAQVAGLVFVAGAASAWSMAVWPHRFLALARKMLAFAPERLNERIEQVLMALLRGLSSLRTGTLGLRVALLSLVAWLLEAGMYYVILLGFHLDVGPIAALLGTSAANLGTMIPSSPAYVGTFDLPLKAVLESVFGIAPAVATGYTLVVHAALFVPVVALGLLFLARSELSLGQLIQSKLRVGSWRLKVEGAADRQA